jgi:uncharacterized protein YndB with AHSA1/START domain
MFIGTLIAVFLLIAGAQLYANSKPDDFQVQRSTAIKATPERIFAYINDFRQWGGWTPYDKDPAMKKNYRGAASGPGAGYDWEGNGQVGQGSIDILQTTPPTLVVLDLHMIKPFAARNRVEFRLQSHADTTEVTWYMQGKSNLIAKAMGLFFNMDQMVGKDFDTGLQRLKVLAEK